MEDFDESSVIEVPIVDWASTKAENGINKTNAITIKPKTAPFMMKLLFSHYLAYSHITPN